jgi:hypothetical protein
MKLLQVYQLPDTCIIIAGRHGAIHVVSNGSIRFVQLTAGASHTFKLSIIDTMMRDLLPVTWSHLEFMLIRPVDDL